VDVPLWEFGEDGWEEIPQYLVGKYYFQVPLESGNDMKHVIFKMLPHLIMRPMPYILPEDLLPWLITRGVFPAIPERKIRRYWLHLQDVQSDLASVSPNSDHHPLWIWGDAANYAKDQNIIVISMGSVLDDETDSVKSCFPLMLCREEACHI
jgi:hypothetical protein